MKDVLPQMLSTAKTSLFITLMMNTIQVRANPGLVNQNKNCDFKRC